MLIRRIVAAAAAVACIQGSALAGEGDIALVIGNNDYIHAPDAETAKRDAELVGRVLSEAGYEVIQGIDLTRAQMREKIAEFAGLAGPDAGRLVVFFSGHALRTGGATYLAPVDAKAESLTDVLFDGVPLELLLRTAGEAEDRAVVFVDAAQLSGFTPRPWVEPGLADITAPDGVLVVSAAPPGRAIRRSRYRDSRFAKIVVERFFSPGATISEVLESVPSPTWTTGETGADLMLFPTPETVLEDPEDLALQIELAFWRSAERSGRKEDYEAYLRRYPDGAFAAIARLRIGSAPTPTPAEPAVDPDVAVEESLGLSRNERRNVQRWLTALGYDTRGVDGLFGRNTRSALARWQEAQGFKASGYLTAPQVALLRRRGESAIAEQERIEAERRRQAEARDNAFWADTGARNTEAGFRAYLDAYPDGLHANEARAALAEIEAAATAEEEQRRARREERVWRRTLEADTAEAYRDFLARFPEGEHAEEALARLDEIEAAEQAETLNRRAARREAQLDLGPYDVVSLEQRLAFLGFPAGAQDGVINNQTRQAIADYQRTRGLEVTGYFDRPTVVGIVQETGGPGRGGVIDGTAVLKGILDALQRN